MVPRGPGPLRPATGWQRCACAGGADRLAPRFGGGSLMGLLARSHFGIQFSLGFQKSGRVFWRAFGGCCFSLTGLGGCGGCSCRGGMGTGCLLPYRAVLPWPGSSSIHGWRWYFPMAHLALAPARAPRAGRELLPHGISTGGKHCLHRWPRDTGRCLCPTPRRSAPESLPLATVSALQAASLHARGSPGDRWQRAAPSALGAAAAGTGLREAAEKEGQNQTNENSPPALGSAAPTKTLVPWAGGNPSHEAKQRSRFPPSPAAFSERRSPGPRG